MQYVILADDEAVHVGIEGAPSSVRGAEPGTYQITLGDEACEVEVVFLADGTVSLCLEGEQHHVYLAEEGAQIDGHVVVAQVVDLRRYALRQAEEASAKQSGPAGVVSPMAGKIARVLVGEGDVVGEHEALLVVEAMKMENEVRAPRAGTVRELRCTVGAQVDLGAPLCRIE